ncbi:hypothetical protein [Clostridium ljungdahlii]|uniref:Lipoprotein n=2 Tax=Clostridium TaxID=1485 RepID=D8GSJ6_CLOLD|nr:hypothetical protein [Clostridium ljungdahlii]ADK16578.1 hypothetical protein CLJU_c35370 [Clostridium ljungdahlii DSM 13528]
MKKHFKSLILIFFSVILIISIGCSNSKITDNKNMEPESKRVIN